MKRDVPHFRIGLLLTEAGILAPTQLDDAIREGEEIGIPFLKVLVTSGSLRQHELQAVIRAQTLIWGGLLDVEKAIHALNIVHTNNVSFDDGLRSLGWVRPESSSAETIQTSLRSRANSEMPLNGNRFCQYCATALPVGSTLCTFCTADNAASLVSSKTRRQAISSTNAAAESSRIGACIPSRDPLCMAFLSGCFWPGVGQFLLGQKGKGTCLMIAALALAFITGSVSSLVILPLSALDAYLLADKLRNGETIGSWEVF